MNGIILFIALIMFLWLGRSILIPLLVATFLWYLINATATYVRKLFPFNSAKMRVTRPIVARTFDWISNILSVLAMCGLLYFFATQIQPMFRRGNWRICCRHSHIHRHDFGIYDIPVC